MTDYDIRGIAHSVNSDWWYDDHDLLKFSRALLARATQPAQAVPLLSDEEIDSVWDAIPQTQFWWRRYARAVEAAVRAKQAPPIPAEQIQKLRHLIDWTDSESYLTFARAIEAAHGIVGKEGA